MTCRVICLSLMPTPSDLPHHRACPPRTCAVFLFGPGKTIVRPGGQAGRRGNVKVTITGRTCACSRTGDLLPNSCRASQTHRHSPHRATVSRSCDRVTMFVTPIINPWCAGRSFVSQSQSQLFRQGLKQAAPIIDPSKQSDCLGSRVVSNFAVLSGPWG